MGKLAKSHRDLDVHKRAFSLAMEIFRLSEAFPPAERYALTDQVRRSSRSITANLAEAWQKRRYEAAFCAKLTDSCAEAAETQDWLDYALGCGYISSEVRDRLDAQYEKVITTLRSMIMYSTKWCQSDQPPNS